jgi:hypothetical protein
LHALDAAANTRFQPKLVHEVAIAQIGAPRKDTQAALRERWAAVLGDVNPVTPREVRRDRNADAPRVEHIVLETETGIQVPLLLLLPDVKQHPRPPVVIGLAQAGKQGFLQHRSEAIARLLAGGTAVCLPDLRGTGETRPGNDRGRSSSATSLSSSAWMLGQTMLGWRLKDLRSTCRWLEQRKDLDAKRLVLWGESFAPINDPQREFAVPLDAEDLPAQSEPGGAILALLGGLFEPNVRGVYGRGGLLSYRSLLASPYLYTPHDAVVPFALSAGEGDLDVIAAALSPRPLKLEAQVDGLNRLVGTPASSEAVLADWLLAALR